MKLPSEPVLNTGLTAQAGRSVVMFEVLPVQVADELTVTFKSTTGQWRQGLWMAVDGVLEAADLRAAQMTFWTDTAPKQFKVRVIETTDGLLRLYNIWDSGRGIRPHESQSFTSGMLKDDSGNIIAYRCNDIGREPRFDKLVFEIARARR